jgi:hypothetical protein
MKWLTVASLVAVGVILLAGSKDIQRFRQMRQM